MKLNVKALAEQNKALLQEIEQLRARLADTEETLNAIRNGEVDAIVVSGDSGEKVFTLTSAETPYRIIIEEMDEGAVTLSEAGTILYCNKRFSEMVAVSMERIIGTSFHRFIEPKEMGKFETLFQDTLHGIINGDTLFFNVEGKCKYLHLSFCALPKGMLGKVCIIITDITELKKYEEELQQMVEERTAELEETNAQLSESNSTKDKLFSIIAHDLKGSFTSLLGYTELLTNYYENYSPEQFKKILNQINSAARNAHTLLENLLMWARSRNNQLNFEPRDIKVKALLEDVVEGLQTFATLKNITLIMAESDDITGYADENMLKAIIRNLMSNAIKYTEENGCIWIKAEKCGHELKVSVTDNGIGMSADTMNKLFEGNTISLTGTAQERGTGLGLVMCKEFVERHHGTMKIESKLGKGSEFSVYLPDEQAVQKVKSTVLVGYRAG